MTNIGIRECAVLTCFWVAGLMGFHLGGIPAVGHVLQVFMVVAFIWVCRQMYREHAEGLWVEFQRNQAFTEWSQRQNRLKGMDQ